MQSNESKIMNKFASVYLENIVSEKKDENSQKFNEIFDNSINALDNYEKDIILNNYIYKNDGLNFKYSRATYFRHQKSAVNHFLDVFIREAYG